MSSLEGKLFKSPEHCTKKDLIIDAAKFQMGNLLCLISTSYAKLDNLQVYIHEWGHAMASNLLGIGGEKIIINENLKIPVLGNFIEYVTRGFISHENLEYAGQFFKNPPKSILDEIIISAGGPLASVALIGFLVSDGVKRIKNNRMGANLAIGFHEIIQAGLYSLEGLSTCLYDVGDCPNIASKINHVLSNGVNSNSNPYLQLGVYATLLIGGAALGYKFRDYLGKLGKKLKQDYLETYTKKCF